MIFKSFPTYILISYILCILLISEFTFRYVLNSKQPEQPKYKLRRRNAFYINSIREISYFFSPDSKIFSTCYVFSFIWHAENNFALKSKICIFFLKKNLHTKLEIQLLKKYTAETDFTHIKKKTVSFTLVDYIKQIMRHNILDLIVFSPNPLS